MNLLMLGAVAGGVSGAAGFFLAGRFHGEEKGEKIYPLYALSFFGLMILAARLVVL